jgi:hypothetical protein
MFEANDEKYIIRSIGRNEVVLFLGAGFSMDATNRLKEKFPSGWKLGESLWEYLGYDGKYDDTALSVVYQAFVNHGSKRADKIKFLEDNLMSSEIPDLYSAISIPFWYKIYTLNIDDIVNKVYHRENKGLKELSYPEDEFSERDQSLDRTHLIYLHGKLPCNPEDIIFSGKQYARASLSSQPLYSQFVYDYATHPTIFIGTDLNEPLFERYIQAREGKLGFGESRPKSFLITPSLSQIKADVLRTEYNVHHIKGYTSDFLNWLTSISTQLPNKKEILRNTFPSLLDLTDFADFANINKKHIKSFAEAFKRVPNTYQTKDDRSAFLRGANPSWNDIHKTLDIPRDITEKLYNELYNSVIEENDQTKIQLYSLIGTAGSGKSTILKRLGLQLSQNGITTFICESDFVPKANEIISVLTAIEQKVVLIFDNAASSMPLIFRLAKEVKKLSIPPILLLSIRNNQYDRMNNYIDPDEYNHKRFSLPDLSDNEINHLISKLEEHSLLGRLNGMSDKNRFKEFKYRANKQILVAMKEATNGRSFNEIIKSEFESITPNEAKTLCLCVALCTELGHTNSKQDFIGFSQVSHIEALSYLKNNLAGTIIEVGSAGRFMIRHRILADYMIQHCADFKILKNAYVRVLSVLAPELKKSPGYSKKFNLYTSLINHKTLYYRFRKNIDLAREVYDSVKSHFLNDAHFWLQYGALELEGSGGDLSLAENYILQAESINPHSYYIQDAKCNLFYKISVYTNQKSQAFEYKELADELYYKLVNDPQNDDHPHIYHIHCRGVHNFIQKWVLDNSDRFQAYEALRKEVKIAVAKHPRDKKLENASILIEKAYLSQAISDDSINEIDYPE